MGNVKLISLGKGKEMKIRQLRCLQSRRSTLQRTLPSILLDGVWLRNAGFPVGTRRLSLSEMAGQARHDSVSVGEGLPFLCGDSSLALRMTERKSAGRAY